MNHLKYFCFSQIKKVDNYYNLIIEDEEFCIRASTLGNDDFKCYPYGRMNDIFDKLEKEDEKDKKIRVKHETLKTTMEWSAENKETIQEMHSRVDKIEHLTILANGPFETWPTKHLENLYKFEINVECEAFRGETFPEELKSISYNEVDFNNRDEKMKPAMIRELLKRCRNPKNDGRKKTKTEAFCHSRDSKMTQQVIEAVVGEGSDFHNTKEIAYVAHQGNVNIIDFAGKRIRLQVFDNKQFQTTTNSWKSIVLHSKVDIYYNWNGSIFERSAQTVVHLEIRNLKESGTLDALSTAILYFEKCSLQQPSICFDSLRLLVLSVHHDVIDVKIEQAIQSKMAKLTKSIKRIAVIALVNTKFEIKSTGFCPKGWKSFHNNVVVGCYREKRMGNLPIPKWICAAIYPHKYSP